MSIPRWRALIQVLEELFPGWRERYIHESSPSGPASQKLARECKNYIATQYFVSHKPGQLKEGVRCEDLANQTFANNSFDIVITQDVFEHVLDPAKGFREIARTLKPGGAHIFTVPWYYWKETVVRAVPEKNGVKYLLEPEYHCNPIDDNGSLVVTEWGENLNMQIFNYSGLFTSSIRNRDRRLGIDGEFLEVFISRKLK